MTIGPSETNFVEISFKASIFFKDTLFEKSTLWFSGLPVRNEHCNKFSHKIIQIYMNIYISFPAPVNQEVFPIPHIFSQLSLIMSFSVKQWHISFPSDAKSNYTHTHQELLKNIIHITILGPISGNNFSIIIQICWKIGCSDCIVANRHQAIILTNVVILSIRPHREHNSVKFYLKFESFHRRKHLKMTSAKWRPFCLHLNVLTRPLYHCIHQCNDSSITLIRVYSHKLHPIYKGCPLWRFSRKLCYKDTALYSPIFIAHNQTQVPMGHFY